MKTLRDVKVGERAVFQRLHGEGALRAFDHWRQTYSPCGSVASIYLWEIAGGKHIEI